jgi:ATP-dependent protease Clp ATPase subunit
LVLFLQVPTTSVKQIIIVKSIGTVPIKETALKIPKSSIFRIIKRPTNKLVKNKNSFIDELIACWPTSYKTPKAFTWS